MTDPINEARALLASRAGYLEMERALAALADECERLRGERDARPEITPEDAAARWNDPDSDRRIREALRAHAEKVEP